MARVKGITKTSLLHNGIFYEPNTKIDIEVNDNDYEFLKSYINYEIPKAEEPTIKSDLKPKPVVEKPNLSTTIMTKPSKPTR